MASEPQLLFDLFDSYWFSHQILNNKPQTPLPKSPKPEESAPKTCQNHDFSAVSTTNIRCQNDQLFINSPNSVLSLQTPKKVTNRCERARKNMKHKSKSKSLSELEFEELKGFMDLGFLFSEKDKDSKLVSIIPGLQRLGKDEEEEDHVHVHGDHVIVSRPYLSEAWGDMEIKIKEEAPRLITIPALGNEADVKDRLRFWAHSVAAVVR